MFPLHQTARAKAQPKCFHHVATSTKPQTHSPHQFQPSSQGGHLPEHTPVSTIPPELPLGGTHPNTPDLYPLQLQPSHQGSLGMGHLRTCWLLLHPSHQDAPACKASAYIHPSSSRPTRGSPVQSAQNTGLHLIKLQAAGQNCQIHAIDTGDAPRLLL